LKLKEPKFRLLRMGREVGGKNTSAPGNAGIRGAYVYQ